MALKEIINETLKFVTWGTRRRRPFMIDVLERHTRSSEERQNKEYKTQPGHLGMIRTDENAETDCCLDIIMITVEYNKQRARQILTTNWNTRKSRTSNAYQKMVRKQVSSEFWTKLNMMQIFGHFVHVQQNFTLLAHHGNKASIPAIKNSCILKTEESKAINIKNIKTMMHTVQLGCTASPSYNRSFLIPWPFPYALSH